MQNQTIWQRLRAFIHKKTTPNPQPPPMPNIKIPTLVWTMLAIIGIALICGIIWAKMTNNTVWQSNPTATTIASIFGVALLAGSLRNWIAITDSYEARKKRKEERIEEDRRDAKIKEEEAKADRAAKIEADRIAAEVARNRRRRGLLRNLWYDIFGDPD